MPARLLIFCCILVSSQGQDCKPPDGYETIKENSKFLYKSGEDATGVPHTYPDGVADYDYLHTMDKTCTSVKLEPWLPRSRVDWEAYYEVHKRILAKLERYYWWPVGVLYRNGYFYGIDNTTRIQDGDFEHAFGHWLGPYDDLSKTTNDKNCVGMMPEPPVVRNIMEVVGCVQARGYRIFQMCQWPKASDCYKNSVEEKQIAAELEANKFIPLASTHSGDIFLSKQQKSFAGAKTLCEENSMRMIQFNELQFKDGDVSQLMANYRHGLKTPYYPFYYWIDAVGNGAPTRAPRAKREAGDEWDSICMGMMPGAYAGGYSRNAETRFRECWCHMPNHVVCIKDGLP